MADQFSRKTNTSFSGLVTTLAIFAAVGSICLVGFETMRQLRRLPRTRFVHFWKAGRREREGGGGVDEHGIGARDKMGPEDWEMGHLYLARMFHATTPSPPMARLPLSWPLQALKFTDWFYAKHTGMDTVVYVRFLRALVWWTFLQTCTTAPILLAIHFKYSQGVQITDMSRASLSWLVTSPVDQAACDLDPITCERKPNVQGRSLLWIHLCLIWWISFTWFYALWWLGRGSLTIRSRLVDDIRKKRAETLEAKAAAAPTSAEQRKYKLSDEQHESEHAPYSATSQGFPASMSEAQGLGDQADDSEGWRQRTLMVMNLPATMRDEASIRRYFEEFLRPDDDLSVISAEDVAERNAQSTAVDRLRASESRKADLSAVDSATDGGDQSGHDRVRTHRGPGPDPHPYRHQRSPVQTVVLVRKMNELSSMLSRRQEVLSQLEAAHVKLAKNAMQAVGKTTQRMRKSTGASKHGGGRLANFQAWLRREEKDPQVAEREGSPGGIIADVEKHAASGAHGDSERAKELAQRLARFSPTNRGQHGREREERADSLDNASRKNKNVMHETVWEALAEVPRELLDQYQPVTRLSALFRGQTVPTIDYLLTKLNLLTALVTEMRCKPPSSYEATSTAFVTFRDPRQARMVWRELKTQIVVKVRMAPEVKDLDWERLMRTSFTGDLVRGVGVNAFFWGFTIFWVIPINILTTGLFSVQNLEKVFAPLRAFFERNPNVQGFVSVTLPTLLVSLITMAVPELIFQISKRAQGFVTFSTLYDQCLCRYWKFVICNVVIFFCIGVTAVTTILQQVGASGRVLDNIAFSFPTAAPFYVSYLMLGMALHTGFELLGFMVPLIQHLGARKAATPRSRALKTLPRNFNRYYWLPFHLLILTIVFIFSLLNPLVIPFALIYLFVAMIVFKKNFAYTYFRRFNEMEGAVYFVRLLRFSLDGLVTAQVVITIFFSVTNQRAVYIGLTAVLIPITVAIKLLGTRLWKSQCRAIEDDEANALCGIGTNTPLTKSAQRDWGIEHAEAGRFDTADSRSPLDARASGRYPPVAPPTPQGSTMFRVWHRIHDSFNANGHDNPSYIAGAEARGHTSGAKMLTSAPMSALRNAAQAAKNRSASAKAQIEFARHSNHADPSQDHLPDIQAQAYDAVRSRGGRSNAIKRRNGVVRSGTLKRGMSMKSSRSDEAPFLSGFDAVAFHAPVPDDENNVGDESFADGEQQLVEHEHSTPRHHRGRSQRHRERQASYSTTIVRGSPAAYAAGGQSDVFGEVDEFGAMQCKNGDSSVAAHDAPAARGRFDTLLHPGHAAVPSKESATSSAGNTSEDEEDYSDMEQGPLVRPHAKLRWDDTPNNQARYNNPFYSRELDPFLWLPRNPLAPLDLMDTVEWHGCALVSSQGGAGHVGDWSEDEDEEEDDIKDADGNAITDMRSQTGRGLDVADLQGDEEIFITGPLAQRLQEAEDAEEVIDPAASLPRNVMDDYKRAIRRDEISDIGRGDSVGESPLIKRSNSAVSGMSLPLRSPSLRARQMQAFHADEEGRQSITQQRQMTHSNTITSLELGAGMSESPLPAPGSTGGELQAQQEQSVSALLATPTPGVKFGADPSTGRTRPVAGGGSQHLTRANMRSGGAESVASGHTGVSRTVTMRQALQAEVLEEERRRTVRERLVAVKKAASVNKKKNKANDEEAIEELAGRTLGRSDTIMARHERALARRQAGFSDGGSVSGTVIAPSERRTFSQSQDERSEGGRFGLRDFSFARSPPRAGAATRRPSTGNTAATRHLRPASQGGDMQMQEMAAQGTPVRSASTSVRAPEPQPGNRRELPPINTMTTSPEQQTSAATSANVAGISPISPNVRRGP